MNELNEFLQHLAQQDFSATTIANYQGNLRLFAEWFTKITGHPATAAIVTPMDIKQYRDGLKADYKPGTINRKITYLSRFFKWAVGCGKAVSNPTERIKPVSETQHPPKWLTRQETYALLREAQQAVQVAQLKGLTYSTHLAIRNRTILVLLLNTGLRVSELCNLTCADVEINPRSGQVVVRYGKGNKRRPVPLNVDARRAVSQWLAVRQPDSAYLFPGDNNGQMTRQAVNVLFVRLGQRVGLKLSPHVLRHTFGRNLLEAQVPLNQVAQLLGHSSLDTTAIYTRPGIKDLERDVDKIAWED